MLRMLDWSKLQQERKRSPEMGNQCSKVEIFNLRHLTGPWANSGASKVYIYLSTYRRAPWRSYGLCPETEKTFLIGRLIYKNKSERSKK